MMETETETHYNCTGHGRHFKPISIYDYPEHLNPFYEAENHKRLRFWTINRKGKEGRDKSGSTWSINSLRDLWAFKTFRMKKRSSTLGISKTSESPPPLRKEFYDNNYNSYNRQTLNGSTNEMFERNTPYRASTGGLRSNKNYDTQSEILFNRNDAYRSTVQHVPSGQRYTNPNHSSVTPVLKQKFGHGTSQTSLRSTNPFDEDDHDYEPVGTPNGNLSGSCTRSRYKKKRRAPAPPPTVGKLMSNVREESSAPDNVELRIVEDTPPAAATSDTSELPSISSLTAEIETLVKSVEEDTEKLVEKVQAEKIVVNESTDENVTVPLTVVENKTTETVIGIKSDKGNQLSSEKIQENRIEVTSTIVTPPSPPPVERVVIQERTTDVKFETIPVSTSDFEVVTVTTITTTSPALTEMSTDEKVVTSSGYDTDNDESEASQTESMSKSSATVSNDLKIIEDDDTTSNDSPSQVTVNSYEIKYRPLNDMGRTKSERAYEQRRREKERDAWLCRSNSSDGEVTVRSTSGADVEYHGERRRSVKEIIEAINRNQSLLQATNYTPLNGKYDYNEHPNLKALRVAEAAITPESQLEVEVRNNERCYSYYDNVPDMLQTLDRQSQVFEKCGTPPKRRPSYEWNPLPKPARMSQNYSDASNLNNVD